MTDIQNQMSANLANVEFDRLQAKVPKSGNSANADKISQLSEDFEAIFLQLMLKSMRDTVPKSKLVDGGNGEEVFRSMLDSEYSKSMAKQRFSGIADAIERSLKQSLGQTAKDVSQQNGKKVYQSQKSSEV